MQPVIQAVDDSFYKITAEGLLVLQHIVAVIRPLGKAAVAMVAPSEV